MYIYIYHICIASTQFDTEYIGFDSSLQKNVNIMTKRVENIGFDSSLQKSMNIMTERVTIVQFPYANLCIPTRPAVQSGPGRCGHLGPDRTDGSDTGHSNRALFILKVRNYKEKN